MIHTLDHEVNTGFLSDEHKQELGAYSLWQSLKMGGVGSPKLQYLNGIIPFDTLSEEGTDLLQINFELTRNALLIRAWQHGDCFIAYVFWKDIKMIRFYKENELQSDLKDGNQIRFKMGVGTRAGFRKFFAKSPIQLSTN